jgi:ComF family protein
MASDMSEELAEKPASFQLQFLQNWGRLGWRGLLKALTPARCLACAESIEESACVCVSCWQKMKLLDDPVCDVMGTPFAYDPGQGVLSAQALSHPPPWDRSRAAVIFDDVSKEFVHAFKYGDRPEAGLFMARLMARAGRSVIAEADVIIPVPLHWTRLWKRRFNQAAFLAQNIAKAADKPFDPFTLKRIRATPQQVGLDAKERHKNMRKAFAVKLNADVKGKSILLVDDVRTTGATISACVAALKAAGAGKVHVLTFALVNEAFRPHI